MRIIVSSNTYVWVWKGISVSEVGSEGEIRCRKNCYKFWKRNILLNTFANYSAVTKPLTSRRLFWTQIKRISISMQKYWALKSLLFHWFTIRFSKINPMNMTILLCHNTTRFMIVWARVWPVNIHMKSLAIQSFCLNLVIR